MDKLFRIKPLEWVRSFNDYHQSYSASTPFGSLKVERLRNDADTGWDHWKWSYCFDEYYDESYGECDNPKEGKAMCEQEWQSRILPMLEELDRATLMQALEPGEGL